MKIKDSKWHNIRVKKTQNSWQWLDGDGDGGICVRIERKGKKRNVMRKQIKSKRNKKEIYMQIMF